MLLSYSLIITITIPPQLSIDQYNATSYEDGSRDSEEGSQQDQRKHTTTSQGESIPPYRGCMMAEHRQHLQ